MSVSTIKKNDTVMVISGAHAGKTGKVLQVQRQSERVLVEGVNLVKKTLRKTQENPQGGIVEKEAPIHRSNVLPHCPACKRGVRVRRQLEGDRHVRRCVSCNQAFEG